MRPNWDEYFMEIAHVIAKRSTCLRRQVGAILVKDKHILASGYNGAPKNLAHCGEVGCMRKALDIPSGQRHELCRALHAEQNAIIQGAMHGQSIQGSTLYTTSSPCSLCAKMLINAEVERIVFGGSYPDELATQLLSEAGIVLEQAKSDQAK